MTEDVIKFNVWIGSLKWFSFNLYFLPTPFAIFNWVLTRNKTENLYNTPHIIYLNLKSNCNAINCAKKDEVAWLSG